MWYTTSSLPVISSNTTTQKCRQCGSDLILVNEVTEQIENYKSEVTTKTYRCSNQVCQDDIDKKTQLRVKTQKEQEAAKLRRLQAQQKKSPIAE